VLGCSRTLPDGRRNLYFITRMEAAVRLFEAGKVDYLIVSGDNHIKEYDEPTDMKLALADAGVPTNRIYCDYAGFRTFDSVVRAREVFGQSEVTVISQKFHNERAIYIAGRRSVDAIGYNAEDVRSIHSVRTMLREQAARVKTVLDVSLLRTKPKFLGPRVEVGTCVPPCLPEMTRTPAPSIWFAPVTIRRIAVVLLIWAPLCDPPYLPSRS